MGESDPSSPDTQTLLRSAQQHDRAAIESLLVRQLPGLEAFVRLRMGARLRRLATPPDVVQSVCREVLEDLSGFEYRGEAPFRHWLYIRAENKLKEKHRFHQREKRSAAREVPIGESSTLLSAYRSLCTPSRDLEVKEQMAAVERVFDELPEDYREAITLHKLCGLSHAEIAEHMGRSEGAVRNLVYRGISRLALRLADSSPRDAT